MADSDSIDDTPEFLLITAPGRNDLFWRPERQGYTVQIAEAGVYSRREAEGIVRNQRGDKMWDLRDYRTTIIDLIRQCDEHKKSLQDMLEMLNG